MPPKAPSQDTADFAAKFDAELEGKFGSAAPNAQVAPNPDVEAAKASDAANWNGVAGRFKQVVSKSPDAVFPSPEPVEAPAEAPQEAWNSFKANGQLPEVTPTVEAPVADLAAVADHGVEIAKDTVRQMTPTTTAPAISTPETTTPPKPVSDSVDTMAAVGY